MSGEMMGLMKTRRFAPLFATQFLGAFNDNLFKNALVMLITFRIGLQAGVDPRLLVTMAAGIFILPFFLFSAIAGKLADQREKSGLIRAIKLGEVFIMVAAAVAFQSNDPWTLLTILFLMGTQSAFFGPVKYGILPDHLRENELIGGNGLIEAGTFLAILLGTVVGGLLILAPGGVAWVSGAAIVVAVAGWLASRAIPKAPIANPDLEFDANFLLQTWETVRLTAKRRDVFLSILGISWFWLVGAMFLAQFPAYAKDVIGGDQEVVTLFLLTFSLGVGLGSLLCSRLVGGAVDATYVPLGAVGMSLFSVDLFFASGAVTMAALPDGQLANAAVFLAGGANWRVLFDLFGVAVCGGIFIVPLYAIMQSRSDPALRSQTIAGNNILNALFMVASAVLSVILLSKGFTIPEIFLIVAIGNLGVAGYVCALLPDVVLKAFFKRLFRLFYRVEVRGLEHFEQAGDKAVIAVNHVSFLDGALLAAFLPGRPAFAINTHMAKKWWVKPFLSVIEAVALDPTNPFAIKSLARKVAEGRRCVIFPEGRITVTGALMKVYEGPGVIADRADAPIVPVRIDGARYTPFSRLKGKVRQRWFPKITLTVLPPRRFEISDKVTGRKRRNLIGLKLYDLLCDMLVETAPTDRTLFQTLIDARTIHGGSHPILEDVERQPLTYDRLLAASFVLGEKLAARSAPGERVGLMLPNMSGAVAAFFALQATGRVPAMLNFSTGLKNLLSAIETAELKLVVTSRRFIEMANLDAEVAGMAVKATILYLEDIRAEISARDRLRGLVKSQWARLAPPAGADPDQPAAVLFTSGSEGAPKGVVLSHRNLLSNVFQLGSRIDYNPTDIVFNALPIFHSFGLTGGLLLPVLGGIRTFLYPSPLHYRIIPELVYDSNATILFGTDTFLAGYARMAHSYDFYSVRLVFAGAEKVKEETRRVWSERFGLSILEGYGATETSPALTANTPMQRKNGTVGRFLPAIEHRLEPVPGIDRGGRLIVKGPNVMLGYLMADQPGLLQPPAGEAYDTGDIVDVDEEGYVTILGRAKRFAKVAGEMVSLAAAEGLAAALWPGFGHAVVALPDPKKGEQLILVSENPEASREGLAAHARAHGVAELMVPRTIKIVDKLPLLGTGKTDYATIQGLAEGRVAS